MTLFGTIVCVCVFLLFKVNIAMGVFQAICVNVKRKSEPAGVHELAKHLTMHWKQSYLVATKASVLRVYLSVNNDIVLVT